jgi:hypothetical protein
LILKAKEVFDIEERNEIMSSKEITKIEEQTIKLLSNEELRYIKKMKLLNQKIEKFSFSIKKIMLIL